MKLLFVTYLLKDKHIERPSFANNNQLYRMYDFFQAMEPLSRFLSSTFNGPYYHEITRVKGGTTPGTDWISKYYHSYQVDLQSQYISPDAGGSRSSTGSRR